MKNIFGYDSKLMPLLNQFADLLLLNFLTLICSLPIITIGASFTAMHKLLFSLQRSKEQGIIKDFFKAFASNFKQASIIWVLILFCILSWALCLYMISEQLIEVSGVVMILLSFSAALLILLVSWVFILQSRYVNPIGATIKNAFIVGISHIGQTMVMVLLFAIPFALVYMVQGAELLALCIGFSFPGALQAKLYGKVIDEIDTMVSPADTANQ